MTVSKKIYVDPNVVPRQHDEILKFLDVINDFGAIIQKEQSVEEVIWSVSQKVIAELDFVDCVIYLYDEASQMLIQSSAFGPSLYSSVSS